MDEQQRKWKPDPGKHADDWRKMWFQILDSRRFSIRQTHGDEAAGKYRPHSREEAFFKRWGKLPSHVTSEDTEVPYLEAVGIVEQVDQHHDRYWRQMTKEYPDKVKAFWKKLEKQLAEVKATPAYQLAQEDRKQLIDFSEAILEKVRNLEADGKADKEAGHKGEQAAKDRAAEADSKEANTNTAAQ